MTCYHIDAFTSEIFKGNPAAVCITSEPLSKELMQKIAAENNLSETAFVVPNGEIYSLRWFTPLSEIDLCGHATLASAFALKRFFAPEQNEFKFKTLSGILNVAYKDETFWLDFPSFSLKEVAVSEQMARAVGARPKRAFLGRDLLLIMQNESEVVDARPDMEFLSGFDGLITHIRAMGEKFDCVSRSFAPKLGVVEDSVCGSGHCHLVPFWAKELGKSEIAVFQASKRGGKIACRMRDDGRVMLGGKAVLYAVSELFV